MSLNTFDGQFPADYRFVIQGITVWDLEALAKSLVEEETLDRLDIILKKITHPTGEAPTLTMMAHIEDSTDLDLICRVLRENNCSPKVRTPIFHSDTYFINHRWFLNY